MAVPREHRPSPADDCFIQFDCSPVESGNLELRAPYFPDPLASDIEADTGYPRSAGCMSTGAGDFPFPAVPPFLLPCAEYQSSSFAKEAASTPESGVGNVLSRSLEDGCEKQMVPQLEQHSCDSSSEPQRAGSKVSSKAERQTAMLLDSARTRADDAKKEMRMAAKEQTQSEVKDRDVQKRKRLRARQEAAISRKGKATHAKLLEEIVESLVLGNIKLLQSPTGGKSEIMDEIRRRMLANDADEG